MKILINLIIVAAISFCLGCIYEKQKHKKKIIPEQTVIYIDCDQLYEILGTNTKRPNKNLNRKLKDLENEINEN